MPHYLHPRSSATSTLFTGCLAVCFLVVGIPHLLPCPVDRRQFAEDGTAKPRPKRQRQKVEESNNEEPFSLAGIKHKNPCPVPKPSGILGQLMGFKENSDRDGAEVIVKPARNREQPRKST